jgi:hypothetical protein
VLEQIVLVTGVQGAGVLLFSGRLRLSLLIAAAVVQLRRPRPGAPRPLCDVRVIRAVAPELSQIASLLRGARRPFRGVALVAWRLTSSETPLYGPSIEPLRQELGRARYLLTVRA